MEFQQAIVRTPAKSIADGLTTCNLGKPDYETALKQHQNYINTLHQCGVEITVLSALDDLPDSCFVEDPAIVTEKVAVLTKPGAPSRQEEVKFIEPTLRAFYRDNLKTIHVPGLLDGGDVLRTDDHFFIGLSDRTNEHGAAQLIAILSDNGYGASTIELHDMLHLKTGVSYLGNNCMLVSGEFVNHPALSAYQCLTIDDDEAYAANSIAINGKVLMPQGFPKAQAKVEAEGFKVLTVDVSEFQKVDGGLSCLSLRF